MSLDSEVIESLQSKIADWESAYNELKRTYEQEIDRYNADYLDIIRLLKQIIKCGDYDESRKLAQDKITEIRNK